MWYISSQLLFSPLKFVNTLIVVQRDLEQLAILLCQIANFLGEDSYLDHYVRDFPGLCKKIGKWTTSFSRKTAPSLFRWLENCLRHGSSFAYIGDLPPLICKDGSSVVSWAQKIVSFYSLLSGAKQIGRKLSSGVYCNIAMGSHCTNEELTVLAMVGEKFGLQQLDLLPSGVSLPLRHVSWSTVMCQMCINFNYQLPKKAGIEVFCGIVWKQ